MGAWSRMHMSYKRPFQVALFAGAMLVASLVVGQSSPPLVELSPEPLYMNGAKAKGNLTIALSVEFPTVGQTYRDEFDATKEYVGYFDPKACYRHVPAAGTMGAYFDWASAPNASGGCGGGGFNGNFMNWATSSAIDILRYGLTGGNRVVDEDTGNHRTIVERAWLPDSFYRSSSYFSQKVITKAAAESLIETSLYNKISGTHLYIYNCRNRVYFATSADGSGNCESPHGTSAESNSHPYLIGPSNNLRYYEVRNLVCDPDSAPNRLMTYDPETREWKGLCFRYPSGKYKPVGQFQMNSENLRVSVFGYLKDDTKARYGGVMRSPLKYLGPKHYDNAFNLIAGTNPRAEWNATTGKFIENPQSGDGTYGSQGYTRSGAIMYINKFGTLNPDAIGSYKSYDPVSELFYEALRYLQGKQPTAEAVSGLSGAAATDKALSENYPVYSTWTNPFSGFQDSTGDAPSCLRNNILTIADVFTHGDQSVPANTSTTHSDFARGTGSDPTLDALFWTRVVGGFESNTAVTYTDSQGRAQTSANLAGNTTYSWLANAHQRYTGAGTSASNLTQQGTSGGTYFMSGLAYWANTQSFNASFPKARVKTFAIDVNEARASDTVDFRRTRQLYLAAKYGGYDDSAAGKTGSPYQPGSNVLWQGTDGDAKNYFLVSDAKKFLDSISEVFARTVEETGSIAGGAISTQRLTSSEGGAVYQARFNPVSNYWSGKLLKYPLSLAADGNSIVIASTPTWDAGKVLTQATQADHGAARNIVIGPPLGRQGTDPATPFRWGDLVSTHVNAMNSSPSGTTDTLGEKRVSYLRGDRRDEQSASNPAKPFRPRDYVLGDIVNSGLVYMGKPSTVHNSADYRTFYDTNKGRKPVIFVNANDGMLHAFYDENGREAFAYVPGFLAPKLVHLPDQDYSHMSLADATPAVGEAYFGGSWKSVLVSGVGAGAQGVFALNVTNPQTFTKDNVMWEFTDRDHAAMGNVIGTPQILKFRVSDASATTHTYKWFAVVPSGVNNYAPDGNAHSGGNPSVFLLDLGFTPSSGTGWTEGTNFWRIELPQGSTAMAKGLVGLTAVKNVWTGAVDAVYAGDLQGNMWKLDFSVKGTGSLGSNAGTNFTTYNAVASSQPLFVAKASNGTSLQPITGEPAVLNGYMGGRVVAFGTGKYLESADTSVPLGTTATFYAVMDGGGSPTAAVEGRSSLQQGTISSTGVITVPSFGWGSPTVSGMKAGWYLDFDASIGERQISDITAEFGKLMFGSIYPTRGSCGEGGGRLYILDALAGGGKSQESEVGVLAAPLVLRLGSTGLGASDTTGQRAATEKISFITQGSKGLQSSTLVESYSYQTGRLGWRQINNYQAFKNKPLP
jgi:type IV pilus assembly protein PilY1